MYIHSLRHFLTRVTLTLLLVGLLGGSCAETTEAAIHAVSNVHSEHVGEQLHEENEAITPEAGRENLEIFCHLASERALYLTRDDETELNGEIARLPHDTLIPSGFSWNTCSGIDPVTLESPPYEALRYAEERVMLAEAEKISTIVKIE